MATIVAFREYPPERKDAAGLLDLNKWWTIGNGESEFLRQFAKYIEDWSSSGSHFCNEWWKIFGWVSGSSIVRRDMLHQLANESLDQFLGGICCVDSLGGRFQQFRSRNQLLLRNSRSILMRW